MGKLGAAEKAAPGRGGGDGDALKKRRLRRCRTEPFSKTVEMVGPRQGPVTLSHCGYVYSVVRCGERLCSAGGDGMIKVWHLDTLVLQANLTGHRGSVTCLAADQTSSTLYSGSTDGTVRTWELTQDLCVCKRTLPGPGDVLCLGLAPTVLVAGFANGTLHVLDRSTYALLRSLSAGPDPVHCVALNTALQLVVCGSAQGRVVAWHVAELGQDTTTADELGRLGLPSLQGAALKQRREGPPARAASSSAASAAAVSPHAQGVSEWADITGPGSKQGLGFYNLLSAFVAIPTISGSTAFHEHCWHGARFVATALELLGAKVKLTTARRERTNKRGGAHGALPVVLGKLSANTPLPPNATRECVVIYAHYDVVFADPTEWDSDPFLLTGRDGYLYGRGVSDDKGPLLASIFATKSLLDQGLLDVDVSFVIEGEEESGLSLADRGLEELMRQVL